MLLGGGPHFTTKERDKAGQKRAGNTLRKTAILKWIVLVIYYDCLNHAVKPRIYHVSGHISFYIAAPFKKYIWWLHLCITTTLCYMLCQTTPFVTFANSLTTIPRAISQTCSCAFSHQDVPIELATNTIHIMIEYKCVSKHSNIVTLLK